MKVAAIDIGTNTTRLVIIDSENFQILEKYQEITRLGENFNGNLFKEAENRVIEVLIKYKEILEKHNIEKFRCVATSVVREATNRDSFVKKVLEETGLTIDVISGKEEAELTFKGVLAFLKDDIKDFLLLDIGGGSNEFTLAMDRKFIDSISLKFGVVFLYEKFIKNDPPTFEEIKCVESEIEKNLNIISEQFNINKAKHFIGTAGTITTIAAIHQGLKEYLPEKINNHSVPYDFVDSLFKNFIKMNFEERIINYNIEKGRADVIIPGVLIVKKCMEIFNYSKIITVDGSLLEGTAFELLRQNQV